MAWPFFVPQHLAIAHVRHFASDEMNEALAFATGKATKLKPS
jgi:hypothetical protein